MATAACVTAAVAVLAGCHVLPAPHGDVTSRGAVERDDTTGASAGVQTGATTGSADVHRVAAARKSLAQLQIAPEDTGAHYDRGDWPHWRIQPGTGGCDTRQVVLQRSGRDVVIGADCRIISGRWVSAYDGRVVDDPARLEIDHVVPLAEVARSGRVVDGRRVGPRFWTRDQRAAYANDLAVLVAVTESSNASKSDHDPAHWMPSRGRCGYVARWIDVKARYELSVDSPEHAALAEVLNRCGGGR